MSALQSRDDVQQRRQTAIGLVCGLAAALIWAGQGSVSAFGVRSVLDAADIVALRVIVAGAVMLPVVLRSKLKTLAGIGWRRGIFLAACVGVPYSLVTITGLDFAPVSHHAVIISGLTPFLAILAVAALSRSNLSKKAVVGPCIILVGVVLIGWRDLLSGNLHGEIWKGDLLFVLGACLLAGFTVASKRWRTDPIHTTAVVAVLSFVYLPFYFLAFETRIPLAAGWELVLQGLYQGLLSAVVAIFLYAHAVAKLGAVPATLFAALVPALSTLIAIPALHEFPATIEWAGVLFVTVGIAAGLWLQLVSVRAGTGPAASS